MSRDQDQRALVDEILRVLRPGGVLMVNDFLLNTDDRNLARYAEGLARHGVHGVFELPGGAVLRHHGLDHVTDLLARFNTVILEPTVHQTMNGHTSNGFHYLGTAPDTPGAGALRTAPR